MSIPPSAPPCVTSASSKVEAQSKLRLISTELVQLSTTRWTCQLRSNMQLLTFPAIGDCLSADGMKVYIPSTRVFITNLSDSTDMTSQVPSKRDCRPGWSKQAMCDTLQINTQLHCGLQICMTLRPCTTPSSIPEPEENNGENKHK